MKKLTLLTASIMAAAFSMPVMADDNAPTLEFHGYFRSGVSHSTKDGIMNGDIGGIKNFVGRLGSEASQTYAEIALNSRVFKRNEVEMKVNSRVAYSTAYSKADWATIGPDQETGSALREFNLEIKGIIPGNPDAILWAGKKFYRRNDIHIIDEYYWDVSGAGGGIENLQVGPGKFSAAWVQQDIDEMYDMDGYSATSGGGTENILDLRYEFNIASNGSLEIGFDYGSIDDDDTVSADVTTDDGTTKNVKGESYDNDPFMFTVQNTWWGSWGWNKTSLQLVWRAWVPALVWAGAQTYSYTSANNEDAFGIRLINQGEVRFGDSPFSLAHVLMLNFASDVDNSSDGSSLFDCNVYKFVVRPAFQLTQYTRILAEVGYSIQDFDFEQTGDGTIKKFKGTLAYAIAPDVSILSRPELRFYASFISVKTEDATLGWQSIEHNTGLTSTEDFVFGIQAEAWW